MVSTLRGAPVVRNLRVLERLLRVREVAVMLSVSTATVYALLDRGDLTRIWVGDSIRVPAASVSELLERRG